jgi:hypothetical protein
MVPDIDLQLEVVGAALRNVVAQADQGGGLSLEQLKLSVVTLDQARSLMPAQGEIARRELEVSLRMAKAVQQQVPDANLAPRIAEAAVVLDDGKAGPVQLDAARDDLNGAIGALVAGLPGDEAGKAAMRTILAHTREAIDIARACCLPAGFETNPGEVERLGKIRARIV